MSVQAVVVPKSLYYNENAYVRRLEALLAAADELIADMSQHEGAEGFSNSTRELETKYCDLMKTHKEIGYE